MSLSKTEVMGEYQSYMGKRALFFLILLLGTALLASMAVTLGSASLSIKEVYVAIMAGFFPTTLNQRHMQTPSSGASASIGSSWAYCQAWDWRSQAQPCRAS